jgi:GNAT superfamily N-acetyltransferase
VSWSKTFVELSKGDHDKTTFDSGKPELNDCLKTKALNHMKAGISRTMVLPAEPPLPSGKFPVCSFYTIAASQVDRKTIPAELVKRLPFYPIPVFLIAQLAVHGAFQGRGLGKVTLVRALRHLWEINAHMRVFAVIVDCLDPAAQGFYSRYGFEVLCPHNDRVRMFIPMKKIAKLFS